MNPSSTPERAAAETHGCSACDKTFLRQCDLNKHFKSHSRPFKCADRTCKYFSKGWPTAKELDRHRNDKHTDSPTTYPCKFPPCTYKSKRASNCKQHMEKAHGWEYLRSKAGSGGVQLKPVQMHAPENNNNPSTWPVASSISSPALANAVHDTISSMFQPPHGQDFQLYPDPSDDIDQSILEDRHDANGLLGPDDGINGSSQTYLPWTSPGTRLRANEKVIETFSQTYNTARDSGHQADDSIIDPALQYFPPVPTTASLKEPMSGPTWALGTLGYPRSGISSVSAVDGTAHTQSTARNNQFNVVVGQVHTSMGPPIVVTTDEPSSATSARASLHSFEISPTTSRSGLGSFSKRRHHQDDDDDDDEDEETETRSAKRARSSGAADSFADTEMPDIFRFAHPSMYHRDKEPKFSPCHTIHKDISTLVRHLSRPAHRLKVTDRYISSFEVEGDDYCHPRVGLCRRCWRRFDDQHDFQEHVSRTCERVSKGKKEKWLSLLEAFTPLAGAQQEDELRSTLGSRPAQAYENEFVSPPSPTTIDLEPRIPPSWPRAAGARAGTGEFITREQHMQDVALAFALGQASQASDRRGLQGLQGLLQELQSREGGAAGHQLPGHLTSSLSRHLLEYTEAMGDNTDPGLLMPAERENLVGHTDHAHMDSQPTDDSNHRAAMEEVEKETQRARENAERATLHHVPTSPPLRFVGDDDDDLLGGSLVDMSARLGGVSSGVGMPNSNGLTSSQTFSLMHQQAAQQAQQHQQQQQTILSPTGTGMVSVRTPATIPAPTRPPPPSNPDSGYETCKRPSVTLTDTELLDHMAQTEEFNVNFVGPRRCPRPQQQPQQPRRQQSLDTTTIVGAGTPSSVMVMQQQQPGVQWRTDQMWQKASPTQASAVGAGGTLAAAHALAAANVAVSCSAPSSSVGAVVPVAPEVGGQSQGSDGFDVDAWTDWNLYARQSPDHAWPLA